MSAGSLRLTAETHVLVLTGAGVSAESGIPTFRDSGGLWESHPVEQVATPQGFERDPALVWRFYSARRRAALACAPNAGHRALVAWERRLGARFLLVTQNVDGLHLRAGSERVIEIHGSLFRTRCARCERPSEADERSWDDGAPPCERCAARGRQALLRPDIVWFGELLNPKHLAAIEAFIEGARSGPFVFLAAGTSGAVYPAAGLVDLAREAGAETWLVNAEPAENVGRFQHFVQGPSGTILPGLWPLASAG